MKIYIRYNERNQDQLAWAYRLGTIVLQYGLFELKMQHDLSCITGQLVVTETTDGEEITLTELSFNGNEDYQYYQQGLSNLRTAMGRADDKQLRWIGAVVSIAWGLSMIAKQ